jgi:Cu/Ag efflux protein CusF
MKTFLTTVAFAFALSTILAPAAIVPAAAQQQLAGMSTQDWYIRIDSMRKKGEDHPWVAATIKAINAKSGAVTVAHGAIPYANMPAMIMTFPVRDPADLTARMVGDQISIQVGEDGGVIKIVHIK